jgi:CHAT domain-containing protein/Tfp pilus assembly protein PilF
VRQYLIQIVLVLLVLGSADAQNESADELLAQAKSLYSSSGPTVALPIYEKALAAYRAQPNPRGEAITLGLIGNCYKRLGDHTQALDYLGRALKMKQELHDRPEEGKTLSHIGLVYWETGDYPKAIDHLTRSIAIAREISDRQLEAAALNNLSLVYDEQGDYTRSLQQYQQALALHRAVNYPQGESDTLGNIGGVYLLLGRYSEAMQYYEQALAISERLGLKPSASQDLGNLAVCQAAVGRLTESLATFDRALALAHETGLKKEEADWKKGKASVLLRMGRFDAALGQYEEALAAYESAGLKRELVEALNDNGYVHLLLGDRRSAEQDFRHAVQVSRQIGHPRGVAINTLALADMHWRSGDHAEAVTLATDALKQSQKLDDPVNSAASLLVLASSLRDQGQLKLALTRAREAIAAAKKSGARLLEAQGLDSEGEVLLRLGKPADALESLTAANNILGSTGDTDLPWHVDYLRGQALEAIDHNNEGVEAYRKAIESIESIRAEIREERFRTGYLEDKQKVYVAMVRLLLRLGRTGEAFQYSERLRARGYIDLLNRNGMPALDPRMAELRSRIRQLQRAIEQENSKVASDQRGDAVRTFTGELADAEREYAALVDSERANGTAIAGLSSAPPEPGDIQRELPSGKALIEYVVTERQLAVFVITRNGLHAKLVPVRSTDLQSKVELLRALIRQPGSDDWQKPAESLRRLLIGPVEEAGWLHGVDEVVIVPHAILHYLPFAALVRHSGQSSHFLVEDYVLSYLPTASALPLRPHIEASAEHLVALAPSRSRLRFAAGEARAVAATFGHNGLALIGRDATETSFKRTAGDYDVIHFATHGFFNKANPLFSGVELEKDNDNDGRLEVHEILGLRLKARLVTLSACETAMGSGYFTEIPAGDEFVGLTRAFLSAGASTIAATLWEVNDSSTAQLMGNFYHNIRQRTPSRSLAVAQRAMLHGDAIHRHPFYWSAFVVVGSGGTVNTPTVAEKR